MSDDNTPPNKRTGRPRAFDRDQALNIALDLFWRHGFEGTSTAQLTAAMGIAPPSLYAAFGSKEALFREALAAYGEQYGGFLNEAMSAPGPARGAVEQMLLRAARQFANAEHPLGCMVAAGELQLSPANAALVTEVTGQRQAAQQAIRRRLEAARKAGELPADTDTATLSAFFAMTIQGMAVQARDGARPALLRRLAELAMQAWPQGLRQGLGCEFRTKCASDSDPNPPPFLPGSTTTLARSGLAQKSARAEPEHGSR